MTTRNTEAAKRDDDVLGLVKQAGPDGISCADMAAKLNTTQSRVYLSVYRLKNKQEVHRLGELRTARWAEGAPQTAAA